MGIFEWRRKYGDSPYNLQSFLDKFHLSRIGIRVLIGQHVSLQQRPLQDYVGIICTKTNLKQIAQEAIDNSRFICEDHYGLFNAPKVILNCPNDLNFMYIPSHLHHMLFELLKNSLRAVVEFYGEDNEEKFPDILLNVTQGNSVRFKRYDYWRI
jgi:pyruvate dehydrogenase kinase 2/3/4